MMDKSKYYLLKSLGHKILDESNKTTITIQFPIINDNDEILRKNINIYIKKYDR